MIDSASVYSHIQIPLYSLELVGLFLLIALPFAAVVGFLSGRTKRRVLLAADREIDMVVGETTLSAILALLGLLLAFSFGNVLSFSQDRKTAVTNEAAALGTAFLRADYLAEPGRTQLKELLYEYSKTRVLPGNGVIDTFEKAQEYLHQTLQVQAKIWPLTLEATRAPTPPPIQAFVAGSVNEALDAHLLRMQALSNPVSEATQFMVLAAALTGLFLLGNRAGLLGRQLTWRTFVFSGFLFVVMMTITDTQRSGEGLVRLDDSTMRATILDMEIALAGQSSQ